jgi:hypothetical protein
MRWQRFSTLPERFLVDLLLHLPVAAWQKDSQPPVQEVHQMALAAQMLLEQMAVVLRPVVRTEQAVVRQKVGPVLEFERQMASVPVLVWQTAEVLPARQMEPAAVRRMEQVVHQMVPVRLVSQTA